MGKSKFVVMKKDEHGLFESMMEQVDIDNTSMEKYMIEQVMELSQDEKSGKMIMKEVQKFSKLFSQYCIWCEETQLCSMVRELLPVLEKGLGDSAKKMKIRWNSNDSLDGIAKKEWEKRIDSEKDRLLQLIKEVVKGKKNQEMVISIVKYWVERVGKSKASVFSYGIAEQQQALGVQLVDRAMARKLKIIIDYQVIEDIK